MTSPVGDAAGAGRRRAGPGGVAGPERSPALGEQLLDRHGHPSIIAPPVPAQARRRHLTARLGPAFERFTPPAEHGRRRPTRRRRPLDHDYIGTEHILVPLRRGGSFIAGRSW